MVGKGLTLVASAEDFWHQRDTAINDIQSSYVHHDLESTTNFKTNASGCLKIL